MLWGPRTDTPRGIWPTDADKEKEEGWEKDELGARGKKAGGGGSIQDGEKKEVREEEGGAP